MVIEVALKFISPSGESRDLLVLEFSSMTNLAAQFSQLFFECLDLLALTLEIILMHAAFLLDRRALADDFVHTFRLFFIENLKLSVFSLQPKLLFASTVVFLLGMLHLVAVAQRQLLRSHKTLIPK